MANNRGGTDPLVRNIILMMMGLGALLLVVAQALPQLVRGLRPAPTVTTTVKVPSPVPTAQPTATVTVTRGPAPISAPMPTAINVRVDEGGGSDGPAWVTALGGFLVGAGAIGTVFVSVRRREASEDQERGS